MATHQTNPKRKGQSPKRTQLPDCRPKGHTFPEAPDQHGRRFEPPPAERIRQLASQHAFPDHFDLVGELQWRWEWWRGSVQEGREPLGSDRRRLLRAIAHLADDLAEAINRTGSTERKLILDAFLHYHLDLAALERDARRLARSSTVAAKLVTSSKRGQRGDPATDELLYCLWRTYIRAFGPDAPRLSRTDKYDGQFFRFADGVLKLFGIRKSNNALGKAIEKALRIADGKLA